MSIKPAFDKYSHSSAADLERAVIMYEPASQTVFSTTQYHYFCCIIQIIAEVLR